MRTCKIKRNKSFTIGNTEVKILAYDKILLKQSFIIIFTYLKEKERQNCETVMRIYLGNFEKF